jgi:uncharacterized 2Fe-2S/4Fe-4S cluster protein (DUF4445 family)
MPDSPRVRLSPIGEEFYVGPNSSLADVLAGAGVEFPCGGAGTCGGCRVRVLKGEVAVTPLMRDCLTGEQLRTGWRLACQAELCSDVTLEVEQWTTPILADGTAVAVEPGTENCIALDLGTTTIVGQLVEGRTGKVLRTESCLNPQAAFGADVMTRLQHAMSVDDRLTAVVRTCIEGICARLGGAPRVVLCGNTVMQHLFCGAPVASLSHVPFEPALHGVQPTSLGMFLPNIGGFVGSDTLAGVIATRLYESSELAALVDLGTNGEIVVGNRERMLCASTAAGPAFEAGRIRMGMRAATGAIWRVRISGGSYDCEVIGEGGPRGICGSGLVDAAAAGLERGDILPSGRLPDGRRALVLSDGIELLQSDIRELQLAKAAIAAGLRILTARINCSPAGIRRLYLAGAFGNYVNVESARKIGLIEIPSEQVIAAGNTALRGTKAIALAPSRWRSFTEELPARIEHISLASDPEFQDTFVRCLSFPERS